MAVQPPDPGWEILLTEHGSRLIHEATTKHASGVALEKIQRDLRSGSYDGSTVAAIMTQVSLRQQAHAKFGDLAEKLLFTRSGLEQASRDIVARIHAQRFRMAGVSSVADLGCGIGGESLALLAAGIPVRAVEIDPFTAAIAKHNLATVDSALPWEVIVGNAEEVGTGNAEGAFLDPARRTAGHRDTRRLVSPEDYSPSLTFALEVARKLPTGIKLGPGFPRDLIPPDAEAQWVSVNGQVVETALWMGQVRRPTVSRSALVLVQRGEDVTEHELSARADSPDAATGGVGEYLYEPDGAVIRARLIGKLAEMIGAHMLDQRIAYMSSSTHTPTPFAQAFRIIDEVSPSEKDLRKTLARRNIGTLEIKKRGADVDPARLRERLRLRGGSRATLIFARVGTSHRAWLCERV